MNGTSNWIFTPNFVKKKLKDNVLCIKCLLIIFILLMWPTKLSLREKKSARVNVPIVVQFVVVQISEYFNTIMKHIKFTKKHIFVTASLFFFFGTTNDVGQMQLLE